MIIEPFTAEHFRAIRLQPSQEFLRQFVTDERCAWLASRGAAYSVLVDGEVMACGGVVEWSSTRGMVWAHLSRDLQPQMTAVHRVAMRLINTYPHLRLQATCQQGFAQGARWLQMLGFIFVRPLPEYGPTRSPHDLYLRAT